MKFHEIDVRGKFWLPIEDEVSSIPHNGKVDEARMFYEKLGDAIYYGNENEWVLITRKEDILTNGSKIMMGKYPLPNYWNIDFGSNDIMPLISNDETMAGTYGGSWTISGVRSTGSHNHGGNTGTPNNSIVIGASELYANVAGSNHTHSIQSDGIHSHTFDGSWRPKYTKFLVVRYDVT